MIGDPSLPDLEDELLARFIIELEKTTDRQAVVNQYAAQHPALAEELAHFEEMNRSMMQAGANAAAEMPTHLGDFRIVRQVAVGGMGVIYEAVQERLNRRVAVKTIRRGRISPHARGRFFREQRVLARLHQTHIVPIHAAGEDNDLLYFAMPFIEGVTLKRLVHAASTMVMRSSDSKTPCLTQLFNQVSTEPLVEEIPSLDNSREPALTTEYFCSMASVVADAAEALEHAHHLKILHRDIKPSNIMIDRLGQCWIIDFGLAGYLGQSSSIGSDSIDKEASQSLTTGNIIGTPQYMAPEQWRGETATVATDVWGLGATLFELLTLQRVFDLASNPEGRAQDHKELPAKPPAISRAVPADLAAVCSKAIQVQPEHRYPSAQALADDLRRWLRHEPVNARPARALRRTALWIHRNPGWAAAVMLLLATALGLAWALFEAQRHQAAATQLGLEQQQRQLADDTSRRQKLMPDLNRLRLGQRIEGWSKLVMEKAGTIHAIQPGQDVRDEVASALVGLDVRQTAVFDIAASSLAFDPTGKMVLLGGTNDRYGIPKSGAQLLDIANNSFLSTSLQKGAGPVAFRSKGEPCHLIPHSSDAATIILWDLRNQREVSHFSIAPGEPAQPLTEFNRPVLALSSDGSRAAAVLRPNGETLYLWDTANGKLLRQWMRRCESLAFSPDGNYLAVGDKSGMITIYSLTDNTTPLELQADSIAITSLAFGRDPASHPERKGCPWQLASGNAGTRVIVWDLQTRQRRCHCDGAMYGVSSLAFSPDGMALVSVGRSIVLWNAATGHRHLELGLDDVAGISFDSTGQRLLACRAPLGDNRRCTVLWDLEKGRGTAWLGGLVGPVAKIIFSSDGRLVAALSQQWQVAVWNLNENRLLHVFDGPHGDFTDNAALVFDPLGSRLACAGGSQVKMWDVETGRSLQNWTLPIGLQDALAFDVTGRQLWSVRCETTTGAPPYTHSSFKDHPRIYPLRNLLSNEPLKYVEILSEDERGKDDQASVIAMAPDASSLVISAFRTDGKQKLRTIRGYSLPDRVQRWHSSAPGGGVHFDSSGQLVGYHHESNGPVYVHVRTGNVYRTQEGRISPNGIWIIQGANLAWESLKLADLDIEGQISCDTIFSPCSRFLALGRRDGSVTIYYLDQFKSHLVKFGNP